MKLEAGKPYITRDGSKVRIVCTDVKGIEFTAIGLVSAEDREIVAFYTADGRYHSHKSNHDKDIVAEYSFWNDVEVDTQILIKDGEGDYWHKGHFAKYEDGKVYAWLNGTTSWSVGQKADIEFWNYAKLEECEDENNI